MSVLMVIQVNNFEQVSSNGHQMSLAGGTGPEGPMSDVQGCGQGVLYSKVQRIMGNGHMWAPQQNDRHDWKHYLPATSLADGNNKPLF